MPITDIILFYVIIFSIFFLGMSIFLFFYNKKTAIARDHFFIQIKGLKPIVFKHIKLRYWITNGARTQISLYNKCDIYLFENYLAIIRRQNFIFKVFFAPIIITSGVINLKGTFNYLEIYKPSIIQFNPFKKEEIEIKLPDPIYKTVKIDITLKGLTSEQKNHFEKIKNWASIYNLTKIL